MENINNEIRLKHNLKWLSDLYEYDINVKLGSVVYKYSNETSSKYNTVSSIPGRDMTCITEQL